MKVDGEVMKVNIYDAMCYLDDVSTLSFIDVIEPVTTEYFEITKQELLALVLHINLFSNAT